MTDESQGNTPSAAPWINEAATHPLPPRLHSIPGQGQGKPGARTLPESYEAERSVLGSILLDGSLLKKVQELGLESRDFYGNPHQAIFDAMVDVAQQRRPVDLITVVECMRAAGTLCQLASYNGEGYLAKLKLDVPTVENISHHAEVIIDKSRARRRILISESIVLKSGHGEDVSALVVELQELARPGRANELRSIRAIDVKPEKVSWLWSGRIPEAKISVLDGDPGLGKSTVSLDLAARLSRGAPMPGEQFGVEGFAIIWSCEDGAGDTLRPRLEAAGANLRQVELITDLISLPEDIGRIEYKIKKHKARLLILDPLMAAMSGSVNTYRDQDIRRVFAQLKELAETNNCAILILRHLNKGGEGGSPVYRGGGSIGIIGAARSGLVAAQDPRAPETRRILARSKCNLAAQVMAQCYEVYDRGGAAAINWLGECDYTAAELLNPGKNKDRESSPGDDPYKDLNDEERVMLCLSLFKDGLIADAICRQIRRGELTIKPLLRRMEEAGAIKSRKGSRNSILYMHPDHFAQREFHADKKM